MEDRFLHALGDAVPLPNGDLICEPSNYILNGYFRNVSENNDPETMEIAMGPIPTGYFIYLTAPDGGSGSAAAQNTVPIDINETHAIISEPWSDGHLPTLPARAANIFAPPDPILAAIPAARTGFQAGVYLLTYRYFGPLGASTPVAPFISVTVGSAEGILVTIPGQHPDNAVALDILISEPGGGVDTLSSLGFVDLITDRRSEILLVGPRSSASSGAASNETIEPPPPAPFLTRVPGFGQSTPGTYTAQITKVVGGLETRGSAFSNAVTLTDEEASSGVRVKVDWTDTSGGAGNQYNVYISLDGITYRWLSGPQDSATSSILAPSTLTNTPSTLVGAGGEGGFFKPSRPPTVVTTREPVVTAGVTSGLTDPNGLSLFQRGLLINGTTPDEDAYIVDAPTTPLDGAVPQGPVLLDSPATYQVALSYWVGDKESVVSNFVEQTLASNETLQITFPDPINLVRNSQFNALDATGKPLNWVLSGVGGSGVSEGAFAISNGVLTLDSLGARTGGQLSPVVSNTFDIDRSQNYAFGGTLVASIAAGRLDMLVEELDGAGTLLSTTTIKSILSSGELDIEGTFGPDGAHDFNDFTVFGRLGVKMVGLDGSLTRNMVVDIKEMFANPHTRKIRRRYYPPVGLRRHTDADPPPSVRYSKTSQKGVELPPLRSYQPSEAGVIARDGFEDGTLPGTWSLVRTTTTGTVATVSTGSAITGSYGYHINKTTTGPAFTYLFRQVGPSSRTNLALKANFSINTLPSRREASLLVIESQPAVFSGDYDIVGYISVSPRGVITLWGFQLSNRRFYPYILGTAFEGDVVSLELTTGGGESLNGVLNGFIAKNGGPISSYGEIGGWDWTGLRPSVAIVGASVLDDPADTYDFDIDDIVISELGDKGGAVVLGPPVGEPIATPDRPPTDPIIVSNADFEDGTVASPWATTNTPSAQTTAVVQPSSAIDGTYGLRVSDTGTGIVGTARASYVYPTGVRAAGFRCRFRAVARPSTGSARVMSLDDATDVALAYAYLDSTGGLYVQAVPKVGSAPPAVKLASGITNSSVFTLEIVARGSGTSSGTLAAWLTVGPESGAEARELLSQQSALDWTGGTVTKAHAGIMNESSASVTATFDLDSLLLTEQGEIGYIEFADDGLDVYQVYAFFLPQNKPLNSAYLRGLELGVRPGETFTGAVRARHANVRGKAYPYYFTAYDRVGGAYPLGSLYGKDESGAEIGASGTMEWSWLKESFVIPEGCYIVRMDSYQISGGEFVCQNLSFSRGSEAISEVYYPFTGIIRATVDTETSEKQYVSSVHNKWRELGALITLPEGTDATVQYGSAETNTTSPDPGPDGFPLWLDDPTAVEPKRHAHFNITLYSDSEHRKTPVIPSGSPYCKYTTMQAADQVSVLLREDGSEFPGNVFLDGLQFPKPLSGFDVRTPKGHYLKQRLYLPVGRLPGFKIYALTRDAIEEIEKTCFSKDFRIESRDYTMIISFKEQLTFVLKQGTIHKFGSVWHAWGEAPVSEAEVLENAPSKIEIV